MLEWVAYHRAIGFDTLHIYSNDCTDGSDVLLDALAALGVVCHHRNEVPAGVPPQINAARLFIAERPFASGDWVMWLDTDEFLLPETGARRLDDLLAAEPFDAIAVPWRIFGDSGHKVWPGRHISADFTRAASRDRNLCHPTKTLFRAVDQVVGMGIHRPELKGPELIGTYRWIFGNGDPMHDRCFDGGDGSGPTGCTVPGAANYRLAQIVHFRIRTWDMFVKKRKRGDGYFLPERAPDRNLAFYRKRNLNDAEETGHLVHEAATTALMATWMQDKAVAVALARIEDFKWQPS